MKFIFTLIKPPRPYLEICSSVFVLYWTWYDFEQVGLLILSVSPNKPFASINFCWSAQNLQKFPPKTIFSNRWRHCIECAAEVVSRCWVVIFEKTKTKKTKTKTVCDARWAGAGCWVVIFEMQNSFDREEEPRFEEKTFWLNLSMVNWDGEGGRRRRRRRRGRRRRRRREEFENEITWKSLILRPSIVKDQILKWRIGNKF